MNIETQHISLTCLFCDSALTGDADAKFNSGDMVKCQECGEDNDYDSVLAVAKEKGVAQIKKQLQSEIEKTLAKAFRS